MCAFFLNGLSCFSVSQKLHWGKRQTFLHRTGWVEQVTKRGTEFLCVTEKQDRPLRKKAYIPSPYWLGWTSHWKRLFYAKQVILKVSLTWLDTFWCPRDILFDVREMSERYRIKKSHNVTHTASMSDTLHILLLCHLKKICVSRRGNSRDIASVKLCHIRILICTAIYVYLYVPILILYHMHYQVQKRARTTSMSHAWTGQTL